MRAIDAHRVAVAEADAQVTNVSHGTPRYGVWLEVYNHAFMEALHGPDVSDGDTGPQAVPEGEACPA